MSGKIISPDTGVGTDGGAGEIVRRGETARGATAFESWETSTAGVTDSSSPCVLVELGDKTTVGESCKSPGEVVRSRGLATSSSSSALLWLKLMARGVLSSCISSSGFSLIGGSLESPSTQGDQKLARKCLRDTHRLESYGPQQGQLPCQRENGKQRPVVS